MLVKEYVESCVRFAHDTSKWPKLNGIKFYTTAPDCGWEESCDNAHGGLDVSWAFHESAEVIAQEAAQRFINEIAAHLEQGINENWEAAQLNEVLKLMR